MSIILFSNIYDLSNEKKMIYFRPCLFTFDTVIINKLLCMSYSFYF